MTQPFVPFLLFKFCLKIISFNLGTIHACHGSCVVFACGLVKLLYIEHTFCILASHISQNFSLLNFFSSSLPLSMALNWVPPPNGTLKVNVHGVSFGAHVPNGNTSGIGVVLRTSDGNLVNRVAGTILGLDPLSIDLWGIVIRLIVLFWKAPSLSSSKLTTWTPLVQFSVLTSINIPRLMILFIKLSLG